MLNVGTVEALAIFLYSRGTVLFFVKIRGTVLFVGE